MTDYAMTAAILWEHMLLAEMASNASPDLPKGLGHKVASYRAQEGTSEARQLAVDLASVADNLWDIFMPVHECAEAFDFDWSHTFLHSLSNLSDDLSQPPRLFQMLAAAEASGAITLSDGVSDFIGLHSFHAEHKMEIIESDGTGYVEDYNEEDAKGFDEFWTVYAINEEGLVFAIADTNSGQEAAEKLATDLQNWVEQAA